MSSLTSWPRQEPAKCKAQNGDVREVSAHQELSWPSSALLAACPHSALHTVVVTHCGIIVIALSLSPLVDSVLQQDRAQGWEWCCSANIASVSDRMHVTYFDLNPLESIALQLNNSFHLTFLSNELPTRLFLGDTKSRLGQSPEEKAQVERGRDNHPGALTSA